MSKIAVNTNENLFIKFFTHEYTAIFLATSLIILTAQISIPIRPVPISLQTFSIMLIGLTMSRKTAVWSIIFYILLGALGLPVFAKAGFGVNYILGPTGGYILGFLISIIIMTTLRKHLDDKNIIHIASNCLIGTFVILALGIGWLSNFVGWHGAIQFGLLPFIMPGIVKAILLAISVRFIKSL